MVYVQRKDSHTGQLETVDQFDTRREGNEMRREYCLADPSARYYLSQRSCKDWAAAS